MKVKTKTPAPQLGVVVQTLALRSWQWLSSTFRGQSKEFSQLFGITIALVIFGLIMVLSASYVTALKSGSDAYSTFQKQLVSAVIGFLAMAIASRLSSRFYMKATVPFLLVALGAQVFVIFFGDSQYGNKNWIRIGSLSVQPSEFLKIALILVIANMLANRRDYFHDLKEAWLFPVGASVLATVLVLGGQDLGTAIVMFGFTFVMMLLIGMPSRLALLIFGAAAVLALALINTGSRRTRINAWLNPDAVDLTGATWQPRHGIWALAAGGVTGTGLGDSKMKWNWIPMVDNDYIFSVIGEEWGLVGATIVIGMYVFLAVALLKVLNRTDRVFERYVMMGIMSWITIQSFINIGVVLNFLPVLGVPLPLISSGGTSLLATLGTIGIALGIERRNSSPSASQSVRRRNRVGA